LRRRSWTCCATSRTEPRIIVKLRGDAAIDDSGRVRAQAARKTLDSVTSRTRIQARHMAALGSRLHVLDIAREATGESIEATLARLNADSAVEYAELDRRRLPHAVPDDFLYAQQWYLQAASVAPSATDAEHAWDITTGVESVVVAFLDTGVLYDHPDLQSGSVGGRLLPGYDFVSTVATANDGDSEMPTLPTPEIGFRLRTGRARRSPAVRSAGARGTERASPASSARVRTMRTEWPVSRGNRGCCRFACSANVAAATPTSSPRCCGRPASMSTEFRTTRIRRRC
jgi:hypothetical protein